MRKIVFTWLALCAVLVAAWQLPLLGISHFKNLHIERLLVSPARAWMMSHGGDGCAHPGLNVSITFCNSGGSWTPASLPGLVLWLSASQGVSHSGSNLTAWADQSGNGYNCNNISGTAPTYSATGFNSSYPGITFTAANDTYCSSANNIDVSSTSTLSYFVLGSATSSSNGYGRLLSFFVNSVGFDYLDPSFEMDVGGSPGTLGIAPATNTASFSLSTPYAFGAIYDGTDAHIYLNNVEQGSQTGFTNSLLGGSNYYALGSQIQSLSSITNSFLDGTIAEVVITNNAISSANRTLLETYFVSKGL
jgi:hypothetical protein